MVLQAIKGLKNMNFNPKVAFRWIKSNIFLMFRDIINTILFNDCFINIFRDIVSHRQ